MRQRLLMGFVLPVWRWFWLLVLTDCDTKTFATDFFQNYPEGLYLNAKVYVWNANDRFIDIM